MAPGLVIFSVMAVGKLPWGVVGGGGIGWAMTVPALTGLLIGNAVLIYVVRRQRAAPQLAAADRRTHQSIHRVSAG